MRELFTCPFCGYYQLDDHGNYRCWTCEDGRIPKDEIPEWRKLNQIEFLDK